MLKVLEFQRILGVFSHLKLKIEMSENHSFFRSFDLSKKSIRQQPGKFF